MDFAFSTIKVNAATDSWGPFAFDFVRAIPNGVTINSATVTSSLDGVDSTSNLLESGQTSVDGTTVSIRLQYPGPGSHGNHVLSFALTLSNSAKSPRFDFGYVVVEA